MAGFTYRTSSDVVPQCHWARSFEGLVKRGKSFIISYIFGIITPMGIIFPDCIMDIIDIMDVICLDSSADIIIIEVFADAFAGIITIMDIFIPDAFMGIIVIIIEVFADAFIGIITIMGIIIIQVMFAGQDLVMGCIIIPDPIMGIIILQSIPAGQGPIIVLWPDILLLCPIMLP
jgi:hypothetical protein